MAHALRFFGLLLLGLASAQTPGTSPEMHPKVKTYRCTNASGCVRRTSAVVLDSGTHWIHQRDNPSLGCTASGGLNRTVCPDEATCAQNCIIEGISDYASHGVTTDDDALHLEMIVNGNTQSPRVYLLSETQNRYEILKLTGKEISYDVDVSKLPCGMNGALYLSEMEERGGQGALNLAGASYGTGYCDAQCGTQTWINGIANLRGKGACCSEMDIWEANEMATQTAPHTCNQTGLYQCTGAECAFDGVCDKYGCGQNPYVLGNHNYYGPGLTVDTSRPFTVVTQFAAEKNRLTEIRRLYVQDGKVIQNAAVNYPDTPAINYIDDEYCADTGATRFMDLGAVEGIGGALSRGMVLVFSIWWDAGGFMSWLDTGNAGPCNATEGSPSNIVQAQQNPSVTFSQIKWGDIGSTYTAD